MSPTFLRGPPKLTAKGTGSPSVPVATKEAAQRRTSPGAPGDVAGPTGGSHTSTTPTSAKVEKVVPPGERRNKTPVYVSGVKNPCRLLEWVRTKSATKLVAETKGEYLMLVPECADGFRATFGALRSLGEGEGVTFHTFSFPEVRCVRLLLKKLGNRMPEAEIKGELEALHIHVQAVMQLRSWRREQEVEKDRPLSPHFIVSVARGPDVAKVRSLTELCGLRVNVDTYNAPKGPMQCKRCQRFGHTQLNCVYTPRCVACGDAHPSGKCHPKAAAEVLQLRRKPHS
jgi:hypothetical protein